MGSSQEAKGLLFALMSPGSNSLKDFTTWYDEDHAPSRAAVPGVLSAQRYEAIDGAKPEWLACYELTSPDVLKSEAYTKLWQNISQYETGVLDKISPNSSRRIYSLTAQQVSPKWDKTKQRIFHPVALQPKEGSDMTDDELQAWYVEEHIPELAKIPGWLRSTRWKLEDVKDVRSQELKAEDKRKVSRFIAIHEWESEAVYDTKEFKHATTTPWRMKVMERVDPVSEDRRMFKLHKDFPAN